MSSFTNAIICETTGAKLVERTDLVIPGSLLPRAGFREPLIAKKLDKRFWETVAPFTYEVGARGSGELITVPAGFPSDLASVPRAFWFLCPTDDGYSQAAVLHDWLCKKQGRVERRYTVRRVSEIFCEAMRVLGISKLRSWIMFRAVLHFGPQWPEPWQTGP